MVSCTTEHRVFAAVGARIRHVKDKVLPALTEPQDALSRNEPCTAVVYPPTLRAGSVEENL